MRPKQFTLSSVKTTPTASLLLRYADGEQFEVSKAERIEAGRCPIGNQPFGKHDQIANVADGIDADIAFAISGKGVLASVLNGLQLHKIAMHQTIK